MTITTRTITCIRRLMAIQDLGALAMSLRRRKQHQHEQQEQQQQLQLLPKLDAQQQLGERVVRCEMGCGATSEDPSPIDGEGNWFRDCANRPVGRLCEICKAVLRKWRKLNVGSDRDSILADPASRAEFMDTRQTFIQNRRNGLKKARPVISLFA
jgi:hypothetical protein